MKAAAFDLNGRWIDINAFGSPEITITHDLNANRVHADYCEVRRCKDWNETLLDETIFDFEGTLKGNRLEGRISVCNFGKDLSTKGWVLEPLEMMVSADGERLDGRYFCSIDRNWVTVTFVRKSPRALEGQLNAGADQSVSLRIASSRGRTNSVVAFSFKN